MSRPLSSEDLDHILRHTSAVWNELRGASLLITGGTGFFGRWLLESLAHATDRLELGVKACILTRDPAAFAKSASHLTQRSDMTFHAGDLCDFDFPSGAFTHVIHAGTATAADLEPWVTLETILMGTRRVLEFAAVRKVKKMLYISSGAIYGPQPSHLTHIPEEHLGSLDCTQPASAYAEGKRAAELMSVIEAMRHGFEVKIARCFAFVGPHLPLDAHFAIGNFIRDALAAREIQIGGDGQPYRSYLYAADLAVWLWVILCQGISGRTYNVGAKDAYRIHEVAEAVREAAGSLVAIKTQKEALPSAPRQAYVPCVQRAEVELGLRPLISLPDAIRRTLAWHRPYSAS
jgi:nucleoside-diphosphate-sugar epimerase